MALNPLDRIARDVAEVKRQLAGRSQINHSSLENTAIPVYDEDGTERLRIGAQDDGTHAVKYVQGPPPPRPTAPVVSVDGPVVRVRWDGELMGGHTPEDFARIDVHFAHDSDNIEAPAAVRANLATAAGSEATLMATQTGVYRVGLVAMSQSRARSEMSETVEVEVQVVDLATAIETAAQSANGKNTVTYSERSPEPTDEGAEGDTWWVNEVRPRDPEDPAAGAVIAITEQWQHTGSVWVQVEMAHEVIASVDLGRATVGFLHGERIEAGTIDTPQLAFGAATGDVIAVDALNFKRAVGLELSAPAIKLGDAVEITEEHGIRQYGPDGALNVDLPSDGSPASVRGDFSARRLTAQHMQLSGGMAVAASAEVVLDPGVTAPAAAPQVSAYWPRVTLPPLTNQEQAAGIAWGEGHWWRLVTTSVPFADGGRDRIEKIDLDGALVSEFTTSQRGAEGFTYLNGELYVLVTNVIVPVGSTVDIVNMVLVYGSDGTYKRRWEAGGYLVGSYGTRSPHRAGIGNDGTNVVIAQCDRDGFLNYWRRSPDTGGLISTHNTGRPVRSDLAGVYIGSADLGAQKLVIAKRLGGEGSLKQFAVYDQPEHSYNGDLSWYTPNREAPAGLAYDGTNFWSLTGAGNLVRYSRREGTRVVGDDSGNWWLAASWRDDPAESLVGPAQRFTWPHRAELLVTVPDIPQGVTGVAFFAARQTSEPVRTDLHWVAEINQAARTVIIPSMSGTWSTDRAPVSVPSFTDQQPGEIRSALGNFQVDGLGAGTWGPLTFHDDGTMTGLPKVAAGYAAMTNQVAGQTTSMVVTLPAGLFTSAPSIQVTAATSVPYTTVRGVTASNASTDSFTLYVNRTNTTNTGVYWFAIDRTV